MKYLLQFQTVDGNGEREIEFDTLEAAKRYEASLEPWLVFSDISPYEGLLLPTVDEIRAMELVARDALQGPLAEHAELVLGFLGRLNGEP